MSRTKACPIGRTDARAGRAQGGPGRRTREQAGLASAIPERPWHIIASSPGSVAWANPQGRSFHWNDFLSRLAADISGGDGRPCPPQTGKPSPDRTRDGSSPGTAAARALRPSSFVSGITHQMLQPPHRIYNGGPAGVGGQGRRNRATCFGVVDRSHFSYRSKSFQITFLEPSRLDRLCYRKWRTRPLAKMSLKKLNGRSISWSAIVPTNVSRAVERTCRPQNQPPCLVYP